MKDNLLKCKICGKRFNHLGSHIWHKHKILAIEYKEEFELPYKWGLISEEIKQKKRLKANWRKTWKKNFKNSKNYQFKKGQSRFPRISQTQRQEQIKRILSVNTRKKSKLEQCPVCKMKFNHLESHLFNAHGLLKVK